MWNWQKEVESAYQTALKKKDDIAIALALSPFARKTAELVNSGAYETAAGSCYTIFRCLAKTCKEHEDWFACKKRKKLFDEKSGADNFIKYNQGGILEENFLYAIASKMEELVAVPK